MVWLCYWYSNLDIFTLQCGSTETCNGGSCTATTSSISSSGPTDCTTGSTCSNVITCGVSGSTCSCWSDAGGGTKCIPNFSCQGALPCTTNADCTAFATLCIVNSCCGGSICVDTANCDCNPPCPAKRQLVPRGLWSDDTLTGEPVYVGWGI
jgi:hypothetical protein